MVVLKVELTDSQIYTLYETVVNNIEDLSIKIPQSDGSILRTVRSGKYSYKWKELHILKDLLDSLIDWDKPCSNTDMTEVRK